MLLSNEWPFALVKIAVVYRIGRPLCNNSFNYAQSQNPSRYSKETKSSWAQIQSWEYYSTGWADLHPPASTFLTERYAAGAGKHIGLQAAL